MKKTLIVAAAVIMLAAGGAIEYARSGKSASAQVIADARAMLKTIPTNVGEWVGADQEFDAKQLEVAEASAYLSRTYVKNSKDPKNAERVTVLIIAGHPGAIGAHDPAVCYGGAGYIQKRDAVPTSVTTADSKKDSLWRTRFETETLPALALDVRWGWTVNGQWAASTTPRIDYAREPLLYKIYVSRIIGPRDNDQHDPSGDLLNVLLPEIRSSFAGDRSLTPPSR